MMPPSAAILMAVFPVVERGRAMALYAGIAQLFLAAGPLLGGALTQWASWRAVFWLNVPVGVAALILVAALPLVAAITVAAQLGGRWYDRAGVRAPVLTGLSAATVGMAAWAMSLPTQGYPWQLPGMITTGLGLGLLMSPTNTDALGRVAAAERSQASGLVQTIRQLGGTLGVAIITAVVLAVETQGTRGADPTQAVNAVTAGFGCAAAAIGIALVAGWLLLARTRVTDDDLDRGPCTGVEEVAPRRRQHQEARAGSADSGGACAAPGGAHGPSRKGNAHRYGCSGPMRLSP